MSKIKIVQAADMQFEVRSHGAGKDRSDEYNIGITKFVTRLAEIRPDILVIPGDTVEHWNANGDEIKLLTRLFKESLPHVGRIVVIDGNHCLKLKMNGVKVLGDRKQQTSVNETQVIAIDDPKLKYYGATGFFEDDLYPITWAVWSHKWKVSATKENPLPYSPYENGTTYDNPDRTVIELFHDPLRSCKGFDGKVSPVFEDYKISLENFGSNIVLAGDIHAPMISWFGEKQEKLFTYCSSLVQRNFGEGNRYYNEKLAVDGNRQHGFNIVVVNTETKTAESCVFEALPNPISRHTIHIKKDFNYDKIEALNIRETEFNRIKLSVEGNVQSYIENEEKIFEHLKNSYDCSIEVTYEATAFDVEVDDSLIETVESITDKNTILNIADKYIEDTVSKTKSVAPEQKTEAIEFIKSKLREALENTEMQQSKNVIKLLSAKISNFMSFSTDVDVKFGNRSINKISGSNGVGKTTIFSFILWMITDLISEFQSARNKNYNYSLYFNDSNDTTDTVGDELQFSKNGKIHILNKTLTRNRKKNGDISGYDVQLSIQSPDFSSTEKDEVLKYLSEEIATFDELNRSMFVNQSTLTNLIKTSTADLNKSILYNIGIDFFDDMLKTYDDLRTSEMQLVEKPLKTVDELLEDKKLHESNVESKNEEIQALKTTIEPIKKKIEQRSLVIEDDLKNLYRVDKEEVVELNIADKKVVLFNANEYKESLSTDIILEEEKIQSSNLAAINARKSAQEIVCNDIENKTKLLKEKITSQESTITSAKTNAQQVAALVKAEKSSSVTTIEGEIKDLEIAINKFATKQNDYAALYQNSLDEQLDECRKIAASLTEEKQTALDTIAEQNRLSSEYTSKVDVLKVKRTSKEEELQRNSSDDAKICSACGGSLSEEKIAEVDERVKQITAAIEKFSEEIVTNEDIANTYKEVAESIEKNSIKSLNEKITANKTSSDELDARKLEGIESTSEYWKDYKEAYDNKIEKSEEKVESEAALVIAKDELLQGVKTDERVVAAVKSFKDASLELPKLQIEKEENEKKHKIELEKLTKINEEVADVKDLEDNLKAKKDELVKKNQEIQTIESELKILEKDLKHAKLNTILNKQIEEKRTILNNNKDELRLIEERVAKMNQEYSILEKNVQDTDKSILDAKNYKLIDGSLKLYKRMLGTAGLPQYIFAHIIPLFNKHLNELLEDVDFRLEFSNEDLVLYFNDIKKKTKRPVAMFISGMETTFSGLALVDVMRRLNNAKSTQELFIDEISGQLNSGKELTYEAKNYQSLLVRFIKKIARHSNVYIIDHVLSFPDARIIEVIPTDNGSVIKTIS